ncbi:hypothetical protein PGTUg99_012909 [Puccinia graminis f. sp. tritici]|uniref:Secreted protein n=1 Tax=Puccinia graminis f. sp. tritici TaxID=56615 RepID=A0A5B0MEX1_PUCGR|nr:hypothetical protein PGTUg99_012909 [Puccinia graminis f. sp. tritici]
MKYLLSASILFLGIYGPPNSQAKLFDCPVNRPIGACSSVDLLSATANWQLTGAECPNKAKPRTFKFCDPSVSTNCCEPGVPMSNDVSSSTLSGRCTLMKPPS